MISNFNCVKFGFLKFYVISPTEINLFGIANVKVDFILLQKLFEANPQKIDMEEI